MPARRATPPPATHASDTRCRHEFGDGSLCAGTRPPDSRCPGTRGAAHWPGGCRCLVDVAPTRDAQALADALVTTAVAAPTADPDEVADNATAAVITQPHGD